MNKPYPGMDKRLSKRQALQGEQVQDWWEEEDNKQEGVAIFSDEVYFGQAPQELLRDPKIKLQPKAVYAIMHSYSQPKILIKCPRTFVSQAKLARDSGLSTTQLRHWIKVLEKAGWLTSIRRGFNATNYYVLHARKKSM